jgi:8-oxo-dGTP pyrophosphatase MutT (NUDIX family)
VTQRLAFVPAATFADGSVADVELCLSTEPVPEPEVFAAMVMVGDGMGRYVVVYSPRRQEWGVPGGGREEGESVAACAVREVWEETGLRLAEGDLRAWGFERFRPVSSTGRWPPAGGVLQLFRTTCDATATDLVASEPDAVDPQWVTAEQFEALASRRFWWPLVESAIRQ